MRDPRAVLGVAPDASLDEIRAAYRRAALRAHPDRDPTPGAAERFGEIRRAYEALRDRALAPARRRDPRASPPHRSEPPRVAEIRAAYERAFASFCSTLQADGCTGSPRIEVRIGGVRVGRRRSS